MSGPCIHYLLTREISDRFDPRPQDRLNGKSYRDIIRDHPVHVAAGAQGPDFLFFLVADIAATPLDGNSSEAHALAGRLARATLDASRQIEELNAHLFETYPILEDIAAGKERFDAAVNDLVARSDTLSALQDGVAALQQVMKMVLALTTTGVQAVTVNLVDVFGLMASPIQACEELDKWWWFDVLHYRRSGEYATALLDIARATGDEELLAYAIGYVSHYAADSVGHPYVNTIVRGPYRHHAQRHKVVENGHDVWAWRAFGNDWPRINDHIDVAAYLEDRFGPVGGPQQLARMDDGQFATSQFHLEYQFDPAFVTSAPGPSRAERELLPTLDPAIVLPDAIAEGIHAAMSATYGNTMMRDGRYPRVPEPDEIKAAYRLWYGWLRGSTSNGILPPALAGHIPPTDDVVQTVREVAQAAAEKARKAAEAAPGAGRAVLDALDSLFDDLEGAFDGSFDADAIIGLIKELADKVLEGVSEAAALIDDLMAPLVEASVATVKALLQMIYQKLYGAYVHFRKLLAASGLGFPVTSMLEEQRFRHMSDPGAHPDAAGRRLSDASVRDHYPVLPPTRTGIDVPILGDATFPIFDETHLIYPPVVPTPQVERPGSDAPDLAARPGPKAYETNRPDHYMWGAPGPDAATLKQFFELGDALRGDRIADRAAAQAYDRFAEGLVDAPAGNTGATLGNAVDLTIALVQAVVDGRTLPNVNLDGDRGIAFPCWILPHGHYAAATSGQPAPASDVGRVDIAPEDGR